MKKYTLETLEAEGYQIRNAKIMNVFFGFDDHDCFTLRLTLRGDGWGTDYGGYCLGRGYRGAPDHFFQGDKKGLESVMRIMNLIGVSNLSDMKGQYVRVALKGSGHIVKIIGNIIEDQWFNYGTFFEDEDETKKDQSSNSACSKSLDVSCLGIACDVCGNPARTVAASAYGPISYAFCDECLKKGLEPYKGVVAYIACAGHFPDDINEEYRADIRRMLPLWGKTEEEFIKDVEKVIEEL